MKILLIFLMTVGYVNVSVAKSMKQEKKNVKLTIIPGKSLGDISIGTSRTELINKGFVVDQNYASNDYLRKDPILCLLAGDQVVRIVFSSKNLSMLRFKGRVLPKQISPQSMRKFFKKCEPEIQGSGGTLLYCEDRGIELVYSYAGEFQGISIVTPAHVKEIVGPGQSTK